jgi:hypothetical protein
MVIENANIISQVFFVGKCLEVLVIFSAEDNQLFAIYLKNYLIFSFFHSN